MDVVRARAAKYPSPPPTDIFVGQDGNWFVPPRTAKMPTHSGERAIINQWGDPRIGIGFGRLVDLLEVYVAGHGVAPAPSVVFVGHANGREVGRTKAIALNDKHVRVALDMRGVDRLEVVAMPFVDGRGFFALDDLRFRVDEIEHLLDFEDLNTRYVLTGTGYAGLNWERGTGFRGAKTIRGREQKDVVPAPRAPANQDPETPSGGSPVSFASGGTRPAVWDDFIGVSQGDPGATLIPPDTHGAVGDGHYVAIVNSNLSAWTKSTRQRVVNTSLGAFWGASGTVGDPRAVWDPHARRFIVLATDFSRTQKLYYAISQTSDPAGSWYKFSLTTSLGTDAGRWPDYPTLGVDTKGIYAAAYMVTGSSQMTIWAVDKAPLLAIPPAVGTITAFRSLPFEGAIQPCTTYGSDPQYFVSRRSSTSLRVRRLDGSMTAPTLTELGSVTIPGTSSAPSAPALGSTTNISTLDTRPQNAVCRQGSIWTAIEMNVGGRAGFTWYEVGVSPLTLKQSNTVGDPLWHYYYPSVAVDANGDVGIGFSGSHAGSYCSVFLAGRRAGDPIGALSDPVFVVAGTAAWNRLDGSGRNRFGDYSHINVDPVDDVGFWSTQEYIFQTNGWRTRITRLGYEASNYGSGVAGKNGVPALTATNRPVIGTTTTLEIGNSAGATTNGVVVVGQSRVSVPLFGGTLLASPDIVVALAIPTPTAKLGLPVPNTPSLIGKPFYLQVGQLDGAAVQGWALSQGLELRAGSR